MRKVEFINRRTAEKRQRTLDIILEDVEDTPDAGGATRGETHHIRPADENGVSTERHRLDNIVARADSTVDKYLYLSTDRLDDFPQDAEGGRNIIEGKPAVVGDDDRCGAEVNCSTCIIGRHNALDYDRSTPQLGHPT